MINQCLGYAWAVWAVGFITAVFVLDIRRAFRK